MPEPVAAWLYDGRTATRHAVHVAAEGGGLRIVEDDEIVLTDRLRAFGDRAAVSFGRCDREGWRLSFVAPPPPAIAALLPGAEHHGGLLDRIGVVPALLVCAVAAVIAVMAMWQGSMVIAALVPERWEAALGRTVTGDLGGHACPGASGQQALDDLAARLAIDGRPPTVRVVDLPLVNAVTLPGRQVVLFAGLVRAARSPDEIAGVLGHEMGHVVRRDALAGVIRSFGISLLIGGADGGAIANALLANRYGRAAERGADAHALESLARAGISPIATAAFFDRLARQEDSLGRAAPMFGYLSNHPLSAARRAMFVAATRRNVAYRPALDAAGWAALQAICDTPMSRPRV